MKLVSWKSQLRGQVRMPGSKSHTIRAVVFSALAEGQSTLYGPLVSLDTISSVNCYRALGAKIDTTGQEGDRVVWRVEGFCGRPAIPENVIDVGNSGTTLRMALGSAALLDNGAAVFTGDDQIRRRPAGPLLQSLCDLGACAHSTRNNGLAPFVIGGKLRGGKTAIEAVSSQYLSSLLINCPLAQGDSEIELKLLNEKPYVEMTLAWLDRLGVRYENRNFKFFSIPGGQRYKGFDYTIPADFSSATFFLCAGALAGKEVRILGLDMQDTQGDKAVIDYLRQMGAEINFDGSAIVVRAGRLKGRELDLNATPDALPALAVTACFAEGRTRLYNVAQARIKETDRIAVMAGELRRLGAEIREFPDGLEICGSPLHGGEVQGHGDHRIVMAMSLAGLMTNEPVLITDAEAAAVTFPNFVDLMRQLGAAMRMQE